MAGNRAVQFRALAVKDPCIARLSDPDGFKILLGEDIDGDNNRHRPVEFAFFQYGVMDGHRSFDTFHGGNDVAYNRSEIAFHFLKKIPIGHVRPLELFIVGNGVDEPSPGVHQGDGFDIISACFVHVAEGSLAFLIEIDDVVVPRQVTKQLQILMKKGLDPGPGLPGMGQLLLVQFLYGIIFYPLICGKEKVKTGNYEDQNGGQKQPAFQSFFLASPRTAASRRQFPCSRLFFGKTVVSIKRYSEIVNKFPTNANLFHPPFPGNQRAASNYRYPSSLFRNTRCSVFLTYDRHPYSFVKRTPIRQWGTCKFSIRPCRPAEPATRCCAICETTADDS